MYQKLLPKLCPHCKLPALQVLSEDSIYCLRTRFGIDPSTMFCANEQGCSHCILDYGIVEPSKDSNGQEKPAGAGIAGTKGLTVVAEILTPTDPILEAIRQRDWLSVEHLWRGLRTTGFDHPNMAGKTAFEHALYKACCGLIDPRDIEADFEAFETYQIRPLVTPARDFSLMNLTPMNQSEIVKDLV